MEHTDASDCYYTAVHIVKSSGAQTSHQPCSSIDMHIKPKIHLLLQATVFGTYCGILLIETVSLWLMMHAVPSIFQHKFKIEHSSLMPF